VAVEMTVLQYRSVVMSWDIVVASLVLLEQ